MNERRHTLPKCWQKYRPTTVEGSDTLKVLLTRYSSALVSTYRSR